MTDVERFQRVSRLFEKARSLPHDERDLFVDGAAGDDAGLREEVLALLAQHEQGDGLDEPILDAKNALRNLAPVGGEADREAPAEIGGYRIVRRLGAGGMGVVWLAEQDHPRREVALKVIRPGLAGRELLRRFELEATVLGRLKHVGIAQIYEAGIHDDGSGGRPFFAMEHVDGAPLLAHVLQNHLGVRDRLELFTRVCDAVHHAHQKGVIHRDLKPGNILVADGQPKVLDFGVARATDADLQATTLRTDVGQLVGTLPYMSPEQVEGRSDRLDTRSDVYALGVILYELLAGRLPYDLADLTIAKAARVISEDTPAPLGSINRTYRGDLSTIVLKALEKDVDRRYASASDLAADVRHYLDDEPIVARPATTMYQLQKFARRNKGLVAGVAAAFLALAVGTAAAIAGMVTAQRAADRAIATSAFMQDVLTSADDRRDVQLVEILREAGDDAAARLGDHPELEADVRYLLGDSFRHLSLPEDAEVHARRAHEIRRETLGPGHPETRRAALLRAGLLLNVPRLEEASEVAGEVLAHVGRAEALGPDAIDARRILAKLRALDRDYAPAEEELRRLQEIAVERLGPDHRSTIALKYTLAWMLRSRAARYETDDRPGDLEESARLSAEVLEHRIRTRGEDSSSTLWVMLEHAEALRLMGQTDEPAALLERVLVLAPPRYGEDHGLCTNAAVTLSRVRWNQRRFEEAAELRIRAIEWQRGRVGDRPGVLSKMSDGLPYLRAGGRLEKGAEYAGVLSDRFGDLLGADSPMAVRYRAEQAGFLSEQGRIDEAAVHFDWITGIEDTIDDDAARRRIDLFYGAHLAQLGRSDEAERRLRASLARPLPPTWEDWLTERTEEELARVTGAPRE